MSMDESTGGPLPAPAEAEVSPLLPNVKGYEEFTVLSSTKQNIELYKLLRAISKEIQTLKTSVETRMSDLEMMIADAKDYMFFSPWVIMIPGIALFVLVLGINFLGDGLRDMLGATRDV